MAIVYRPATPQDRCTLLQQPTPRVSARLANALRGWRRERSEISCAEFNGQPVGYLEVQINRRGCGRATRLLGFASLPFRRVQGPDAMIQPVVLSVMKDLYVAPSFRNRGVARGLVDSICPRLRELNVDQLQASVNMPCDWQGSLLKRLGFESLQFVLTRDIQAKEHTAKFRFDGRAAGIREARISDLSQLIDLVRLETQQQQSLAGCFQLHKNLDWSSYIAERLRRRDITLLVLERSGQLVAYTEIRCLQPPERRAASRVAYIEDIYVVEGARNERCATSLLQCAIDRLQQHKVSKIHAAVWAGNQTSLHLAKKLGFRVSKQIMAKPLKIDDFTRPLGHSP